MYGRLNYLYKTNKISEVELQIAVSKRWISEEEMNLIVAE